LRFVDLNDEAVCGVCFLLIYQDKKYWYTKEFFQRSFETGVIMSHGLYKCI